MKKFIKKIILFGFFVIIIKSLLISAVLFNLPLINYDYFLGESDKKNKIIIVGSSNVRHNFDFELLNKNFENYSVLGISLNASDGLYALFYKLDILEINEDDIIIFALPYSLYNESRFLPLYRSNKFLSFNVVKNAFFDFPQQTIKSLSLIKFNNFFSSLKTINLSIPNSRLYKSESSNNLNRVPFYKDKLYYNCYNNEKFNFSINDNIGNFNVKGLNQIDNYIRNLNPKIYFRHPIVTKNKTNLNIYKISNIEETFTFINNTSSAEFEKSLFYDKWYHLNFCGSQKNSLNLIKEINPFIENKNLTKP